MFDHWRGYPEGMQRFWLMILANIKLFKLHSKSGSTGSVEGFGQPNGLRNAVFYMT